jgi:polysaccharide pyruvyl transferase CsaB
MKQIVVSGYYGFDNLGDEAILAAIVQSIRQLSRDFSIVVLSNQPQITSDRYKVDSVSRNDFKVITKTVKESDLLISGGGSLLQDVTSWRTIPYYLGLVWFAQLSGKKTVFYAQGIGPIKSNLNRRLVKWVGNRTDMITVRDQDSASLLEGIGIPPQLVSVTVDPVFAFDPELFTKYQPEGLKDSQERLIGISVRPWGDNSYLKAIAQGADLAAELIGGKVVLIPMHQGQDLSVSSQVQKMMEHDSILLDDNYTSLEMIRIYKNFDLFLGVRLHSLIFAAVNRIPFIGISYDPKVDSLMAALDMESGLTTDSCSYSNLKQEITKTWEQRDKIIKRLDQRVSEFHRKARENVDRICELM